MPHPSKDPLVVKLSPLCWLATLRAWEGLRSRGLLAASGSGKFGCSLCFADASERGVNPRLEVGGSACFPLALRSPGCGCFRLRLDFQVTVSVRGGVKGVNPGFLVLAFSARTLKSSGVPEDECRPGASAWACCLWFVTLLHVRGSWSSCVFVRSTVVAFWGDVFISTRIPLWLSCLHRVGLQQFGEREGLSEQRALG